MFGIPMEVIVGLITAIGGFMMKQKAQQTANQFNLLKMSITTNKSASKLADAADKRGSPWARKAIAFFIILIAFGGLWIAMYNPDIPVTIVEPVARKSFLWFEWGKSYQTIVANGLVFPEWVKYSVITVVSFYMGTGAGKIT